LGDLHSRLMAESRAKFLPERIYASQVLDTGGKPLRDAPSSPVVVIGDSYTGVFQQVLPGSAGFSAHLAYHLKAPVDLVMGWGGGPEAPAKLMRRGSDYTKSKRLVIWVMSARDLLTYPGEWQKGT